MEKAFNILYFNFCLLNYYQGKVITVYLNPICWVQNLRFMKLGVRLWNQQMGKNYSPFLYQIKYDRFLKHTSLQLLVGALIAFDLMITLLLQSISKGIYIFSIVGFLFSYIGPYNFIDVNDKYYEYQQEFMKSKKYKQPILTLVMLTSIIIIIYILFSTGNYLK